MSSKPYQPKKPTAYVPFLRRFTDEREREKADTIRLYRAVTAAFAHSGWSDHDPLDLIFSQVRPQLGHYPTLYANALATLFIHLTTDERVFFPIDEPQWDVLTLQEGVEVRALLRAQEYFLVHQQRLLALYVDRMVAVMRVLADDLPIPADEPSLFSISLYELIDVNALIEAIYDVFASLDLIDSGLFTELRQYLYLKLCNASGASLSVDDPKVIPAGKRGLPPAQAVEAYLGGTAFAEFLAISVPLRVPLETFFSHTWIVAGSGTGKTQFLQNLILHFLEHDERPSLVVVDSQADMIAKLSRLQGFASTDTPLILITPKDIAHPPAINIFDLGQRMRRYDPVVKEQVVAGAIQTLEYLFSGVIGADLTAKQNVFFRFISRLLISLPETLGRTATLLDMLAIMDNIRPYEEAIAQLPPIQRAFFERDFAAKGFAQTKEQIKYRLNAILENPTLERLFTAPRTQLDLFAELNTSGSVILVDTSREFLKGASAHFGRIFISLVLKNILERAAIPEHQRHPTFLVIDEAAEYFDTNIDDLLNQARKYRCGVVMAHQYLDQANPQLRSSLASNTAIKMAAGVSTADARHLAPDMRTTADFILRQPRLHFSAFVRGLTPQAISVPVEVGKLEAQERMSAEGYQGFLASNAARVSAPAAPPETQRPPRREAAAAAPPSAARRPTVEGPHKAGHNNRKDENPDHVDTKPSSEW